MSQILHPIELHRRDFGQHGERVLLLHGLFGSWENLGVLARELSAHYRVTAVDLRNHGLSPHREPMDYPHMAEDVAHVIGAFNEPVHLIGHSMGGKVAMLTALHHADKLRSLTVLDIAPKRYDASHTHILEAMNTMPLERLDSRSDANQWLARHVDDASVRGFLLKNLQRSDSGILSWRLNLDGIRRHYDHILDWPEPAGQYTGATLVLSGGRSTYVSREDAPLYQRWFPAVQGKQIADAGHWLHAEKPEQSARLTLRFLQQLAA